MSLRGPEGTVEILSGKARHCEERSDVAIPSDYRRLPENPGDAHVGLVAFSE